MKEKGNEGRGIVTTFEGLVEALEREREKLRAVDIYLNDDGKCRLRACDTLAFLADFCDDAKSLDDMDVYSELSDDAVYVRDIIMAIERIVKLEKLEKGKKE